MRFAPYSSGLLLLAQLAAAQAYTVDPPTTAPADTIEDCTNWYVGVAGDACSTIASNNFIEVTQLYSYVRFVLTLFPRNRKCLPYRWTVRD